MEGPAPLPLPLALAPHFRKFRWCVFGLRFLDSIAVRLVLIHCWLLTLGLALGLPDAHAQESADESLPSAQAEPDLTQEPKATATPTTKPWQTQAALRPAAPDVYLLPDEFGKLRQVLGFRYEDFFEAWNHNAQATVAVPPRFVIDTLEISGKVQETHARLRIVIKITVQTAGWVAVPVQLSNFIVQQVMIEGQAEGECFVFDKQRFGHLVWLSGNTGSQRKLVLEGLARLKLNTGSQGIELNLPRATTSQFSLRLPNSSSRFESSPELTLTTLAQEDETTEVRLLGQANPLRLNWTPAEKNASNQAKLVEVEGQTTVHLDRRRVSYSTTLLINSFDSPLEQIQVRLPKNAKLKVGETPLDYEINEVDPLPLPDKSQAQAQVVAIRLKEPRLTPWELHLTAESPLESLGDSAKSAVAGFEVLDAFRQSGTVTLAVDNQLRAYFDLHGEVDQIPLPANSLAPEGSSILGEFRYARFPWQLVVFTSPRQRRLSVQPQYELMIHAEEARLEVEYNYQLTGAQIFFLRVNLQGWKLSDSPIESGGLINVDGIVVTREGQLVLPLVDPETPQLRLNFSLQKDLQLGDNTFFLPEPLRAHVIDAELKVDSTEALLVTPKFDEIAGLRLISPADEPLGLSSTQGVSYTKDQIRLRTFLSRPKFVAEVVERQREVIATQHTQVKINQRVLRVRQQIDYLSKYQPVSQLTLSVPQALGSNDSLTVTLDGEPLPVNWVVTSQNFGELPNGDLRDPTASEVGSLRRMVVSLPRPMQNDIPIEITYELPTPELSTDTLAPVLLPLVLPEENIHNHLALINAPPSVIVTANQRSTSDEWRVVTERSSTEASTAALTLQTDEKLSFLSLYAQIDSEDKEQLATLERAWIQSWMTPVQRQERAVFRFRTTHSALFVQLPATFDSPELEVLLDGEPQKYEFLADNRLEILLPLDKQHGSHSLELRYQQSTLLPSWGKINSLLPRLECLSASAPIYWQLVLPRSWQLTSSPPQLIADYWLGWKHYRWGRQPALSQQDLEQRTGATSAIAPTALSTQYVFRAFEVPEEVQVVVIRQAWLVMGSVLAAFGFGLLGLYTSLARSGVFWLCLALTLLAGIFSYPEIALLAIEVVLAGGLMTFVARVLRQVFASGTPPRQASAGHLHEESTQVTELWQRPPADARPDIAETTASLPTSGPSP